MTDAALMEAALLVAAAAGYLLGAAAYGSHLLLRRPALALTGRLATLTAIVLHTLAIGVHCARTHQTPFTTAAETLSASAWAIALAYLLLELACRPRPLALGAVALPTAFLFLLAGALGRHHSGARYATALLNSRLTTLHILAVLLAFGLLALAFGCAALYLAQDRMLKRKRLQGGLFGKLPPLARLDQMAFTLVAFAFPLLTIGLAAGLVEALTRGPAPLWAADPNVLASGVTWLVYGLYLALHTMAHWRGPRAHYLLLGGLLAALITYVVPSSLHRFG